MREFVLRGTRTRILGTLGLVAIAAAVMLACGGGATASGTTTTGGNTGSSSTKHFKVGDQVKVGDNFVVTVNSVKTSQGDDITQPKSGDTFLIVDVTVKNVSNQSQDISSALNFDIQDATGQKYTETIVDGETPPDGTVQPGDLLRGQLSYEVPASQKSFEFSFQDVIGGGDEAIWDLSA